MHNETPTARRPRRRRPHPAKRARRIAGAASVGTFAVLTAGLMVTSGTGGTTTTTSTASGATTSAVSQTTSSFAATTATTTPTTQTTQTTTTVPQVITQSTGS